jgi:LacI family transcriptional regulator
MRKPRRGATPAEPKVTKRRVRQRVGVNINDIAERAGVAPATVSRALNGYEDIAEATRERILALARQLNYQPSSRARQLARGSVETVSFVLPVTGGTSSDPFMGDFLDSLAAALAERDYDLLVATVREGETDIEVYRRLIAARKCAGFIVTNSSDDDPRIKLLQDLNVPFVVYGRAKMERPYAHLDMDNEAAIAGMVDHLVALGHRRFAYLDLENPATFSRLRRAGFDHAVEKNAIGPGSIARLVCAHSFEGGQSAVASLFDAADAHRPTAIVCPADVMAVGAIQAISARGYKVGRDVSITGYDGAPLGAFTSPPLTTMSQPIEEVGQRLIDILFHVMQGADPANFGEVLMPTLVRRASDGSPSMVEGAAVS